jgi:hypothetical protein
MTLKTDTPGSNEPADLEAGVIKDIPSNGQEPETVSATLEKSSDLEEKNDVLDTESAFTVWWDSDDDPQNPMNWSPRRKWLNISILSFITFLT